MAIETVYADAVVANSGLTGDSATLGAPDGSYSTNTGSTSWSARWSFTDPVNPLTSGVTNHQITVTLRKEASGGGTPTVAIALYDNGSLVRSIISGITILDDSTGFSVNFATSEVTSGSTVEVDLNITAAGGSPANRRNVQIDAITVEMDTTAAGDNFTETPDDDLGLDDATALDRGVTLADAEDLTDEATLAVDAVRGQDDDLGLTDDATGVISTDVAETPDDDLGLSDDATIAQGRLPADSLGLDDEAAPVASFVGALADDADLADDATIAQGRLPVDALGLTDDAAAVISKVATRADNIGLTDAAALTIGRNPADDLSLTDEVGLTIDVDSTPADTADLADAVSVGYGRAPSDNLGLTDDATGVIGSVLTETPADDADLADAVSVGYGRALADELGLTDIVALTLGRNPADSLGLADEADPFVPGSANETPADDLALSDETVTVHDAERPAADELGLTDAVTAALEIVQSAADELGLTDAAIQGASVEVGDTLGLLDALLVGRDIAVPDTAGLVDVVALVAELHRVAADAEPLTDSVELSRGFTFTEALGLTDSATADLTQGRNIKVAFGRASSRALGLGLAVIRDLGEDGPSGRSSGGVATTRSTLTGAVSTRALNPGEPLA